MDLDTELFLLKDMEERFQNYHEFLNLIQKKLADKPAIIQRGFTNPLTNFFYEMLQDLGNPDDDYLNQETEPIKVD